MRQRLAQKIKHQTDLNLLRTLDTKQYKYNFASNDYLGLASERLVKEALIESVLQNGVGSCAAQTIGGFSAVHAELVEAICQLNNSEDACLFSSGFMANLAILNTLSEKGQAIYLDRKAHASLINGALMSKAELVRYQHLDVSNLKQKITKPGLIVTESVFSMSGAIAPVQAMAQLTNENLNLIVDDAHGLGLLGANGKGAIDAFTLGNDVTCTITFGKALGTSGAAVIGNKTVIEAIRQFASSYLFTTSIPAGIAAATKVSIGLLQKEAWRHASLVENIAYFKEQSNKYGILTTNSETAIQYLKYNSLSSIVSTTSYLANKGIRVQAIRPPTVAQQDIGIRVVLSALHQKSEIDKLFTELMHAKSAE